MFRNAVPLMYNVETMQLSGSHHLFSLICYYQSTFSLELCLLATMSYYSFPVITLGSEWIILFSADSILHANSSNNGYLNTPLKMTLNIYIHLNFVTVISFIYLVTQVKDKY